MYGKKAIYFNYRSYGGFIAFMLIPGLLVLMGGSIAYSFLAWQPIFIGLVLAAMLASPGYPRFMAISANADIKANKYTKALKRTRTAVRLPFAPVSVKIFHAYVLLLNGMLPETREQLKKLKDVEMVYSEKAKWDATNALLKWVETKDPAQGLKYLDEMESTGADEAIAYTKGKLLNITDDKADARKYNDKAYEMNTGNRDILSNLIIAYCRTGQIREAKILFRTLYSDLGTTSDALYFMAKIKEDESKKADAVEFIEAALEIESAATDLISKEGLQAYKEKLEASVYEI